MSYRATIGLEVHAELRTKTKMFCSCKNDPDEDRVNVNVCPICLAHPGTLPVVNQEAVHHILRMGSAIKGELSTIFSEFDRKSYFYPDIPKGYQISQYELPIVKGGTLNGVAVTRIHLEEDTARSIHAKGKSLVDFNRAGVPLMELVTEPVIHDAETAGNFARELQLLLRTLGAGEANLEKGEMRIEANISVSKTEKFGTKVEVKNLNSFRSVERAITFEIQRQRTLIESGGEVTQETRGWNEGTQETFHQRFKEGSADYRYFPEPDIPKLLLGEVTEFTAAHIEATLPELPWERRARYESFGLAAPDALFLSGNFERGVFFDAVITELGNDASLVKRAANYVVSDLAGLFAKVEKESYERVTPEYFAKLIHSVSEGTLSSRGAKDVLVIMVEKGGDPESIAKDQGLLQVHDVTTLEKAIDTVLAEEVKAVGEYRAGKEASLQYLIGKGMKATRGAGNPGLLKEIIVKKLS